MCLAPLSVPLLLAFHLHLSYQVFLVDLLFLFCLVDPHFLEFQVDLALHLDLVFQVHLENNNFDVGYTFKPHIVFPIQI